jgi:hypothetical protein
MPFADWLTWLDRLIAEEVSSLRQPIEILSRGNDDTGN